MKLHALPIKEVMKRVFGLPVTLAAIWLLRLGAGPAEAMHRANPCYARGNYSGSWLSGLFVFSILLLGVCLIFGPTISKKIKKSIRPRRRR